MAIFNECSATVLHVDANCRLQISIDPDAHRVKFGTLLSLFVTELTFITNTRLDVVAVEMGQNSMRNIIICEHLFLDRTHCT